MVEPTVLRELLAQAQAQGGGFTEALVAAGYVADWDLSRIVCEIFQLAFLPVDVLEPDPKAMEGLDKQLLLQHALVPVARFGQVLTISMPALVPAEVLGLLAADNDLVVLPVVGTVQTNRSWVEAQFAEVPTPAATGATAAWGELFDEADAAVLHDLQKSSAKGVEDALEFDLSASLGDSEAEIGGLVLGLEVVEADLELETGAAGDTSATLDLDAPGPALRAATVLPPAPRFT